MLQTISMVVVIVTGIYFVALGFIAIFVPTKAQSFLLGFADTAAKHYAEIAVRFIVGGALIVYAPNMRFSGVFLAFGWILAVTTLGMLLVPWRWHEKFAKRAVPKALRYQKLIGLSSAVLGVAMFYSMIAVAM